MTKTNRFLPFIILINLFIFSNLSYSSNYPDKVVVTGGSITEIIYALGESDRIVGVDSTSVFPKSATEKPQVGYVRRINVEGILSLEPQLLLGEADTGPKKVLQQLQQTGLKTEIFSTYDDLNSIEKKILRISELLGTKEKGKQLAASLSYDRQALEHILAQSKTVPNVLFVLSLRGGQPIVAGNNTSANQVINAAGGLNIAASHFDSWKPLALESAVTMNPDIIIAMGRHGQDKIMDVSKLNHFKFSNAVKNKRVLVFDGSYLLGMGPRTPQAVVELATKFHPKASLPENYRFRHAPASNIETL